MEAAKSEFVSARAAYIDSYGNFLEKLMALLRAAKSAELAEDRQRQAAAQEEVETFTKQVLVMQEQLKLFLEKLSQASSSDTRSGNVEMVSVPGRAKSEDEEEAKRKAEEEAKRQAEEDKRKAEEAKRKMEEEAKRKADEDAKRQAEEDRRKAEEAKRKMEEEAKRKADEEAKRKADEEAKRKAEEEAKRQAEEDRRKAEEAKRKEKEEAEAKRRAEEEALAAGVEEVMPTDTRLMTLRVVSAFFEFRYNRKDFRHVFDLGQVNNSASVKCPETTEQEEASLWRLPQPQWLLWLAEATVQVLGRSSSPALWLRLADAAGGEGDDKAARMRKSTPSVVFDAIPPPRRLTPPLRRQTEAMLLALQLSAGT